MFFLSIPFNKLPWNRLTFFVLEYVGMLHVHYRTSVTIFEAAVHKEWGKKRRNHIIYWRYKKLNRESINQKLVVPKRKRSCCTLLTLWFQINLRSGIKIPIPDKTDSVKSIKLLFTSGFLSRHVFIIILCFKSKGWVVK